MNQGSDKQSEEIKELLAATNALPVFNADAYGLVLSATIYITGLELRQEMDRPAPLFTAALERMRSDLRKALSDVDKKIEDIDHKYHALQLNGTKPNV